MSIRWHKSHETCPHSNENVCPTCDFDGYYAATYPDCPWRVRPLDDCVCGGCDPKPLTTGRAAGPPTTAPVGGQDPIEDRCRDSFHHCDPAGPVEPEHPCPDMSCPHCPCTYTAECCHCGDGQVHK